MILYDINLLATGVGRNVNKCFALKEKTRFSFILICCNENYFTSLTKLNMGKAEKERTEPLTFRFTKTPLGNQFRGEKGGDQSLSSPPPSTLIPKLLFSLNSHGSFSTSSSIIATEAARTEFSKPIGRFFQEGKKKHAQRL